MDERSNATDEGKNCLSREVFQRCYDRYSAGVRALLRSKLGNEADVDDCLSCVFEKLWTHGAKVAPAALGAWLFVVAGREVALHWRRQRREASTFTEFSHEPEGSSDTPDERLIDAEQMVRLTQAAQRLPEEQRIVLQRRFIDDLSFREIAEELNIPLGTALTRLHSALKRLRKILHDPST